MAFFFACVSCRHKKVGVPADLVLVSTCKEMRGLEEPPRAIRDDSRAILGTFEGRGVISFTVRFAAKEKGAKRRPKLNEIGLLS